MKKILAISLAALLAFSVIGCSKKDTEGDDVNQLEVEADVRVFENFEYAVNDSGNYEIVGYTKNVESIEVISSIEGRPVTGIGENAFKAVKSLKSIKLPDTITYIDDFAFYACTGLTEIVLPNSVTEIGTGAFQSCTELTKITLSTSLVTIEDNAFYDCQKLTNVTLPETLEEIGMGAFWRCYAFTEIAVPASVTEVDAGAFWGCKNITKLTVDTKDIAAVDEDGEPVLDDNDQPTYVEKDFDADAFPYGLTITVTDAATLSAKALTDAGYAVQVVVAE